MHGDIHGHHAAEKASAEYQEFIRFFISANKPTDADQGSQHDDDGNHIGRERALGKYGLPPAFPVIERPYIGRHGLHLRRRKLSTS